MRHKHGDIGPDGMVFWSYNPSYKTGEYWVSAEKFAEKRAKANASQRKAYHADIEASRKKQNLYRSRNRDRYSQHFSKWYYENPEYGNVRKERKTDADRERERAKGKIARQCPTWKAKNAERSSRIRFLKKCASFPEKMDDVVEIYETCADLNLASIGAGSTQRYEVDHIFPLYGDGFTGLHVPLNLRIITREENRMKRNKTPTEVVA